ncbi:MAG: 4-hydroxy-tetrahydrodipicolinate synthase [Ectothiorhodospiraceae bacterium]|nr:4-hydroxy-tetrahydrodipicolinate synthase [Ectothiorhodospiraceae bacterium]
MANLELRGAGTALVTPFTSDNKLDLEKIKFLAERQITNGIDMLIPCGTTGETVNLSMEEYEAVVATVVETANKRVKVIAGSGTNSTKKTIEMSKVAEKLGVDGLLVVGPYYNKPTQEGYYQHFKTVADAVNTPIVMYNVPGRTGSNIDAATQLRIAGIDKVVATKEASGNLPQNMAIVMNKPDGFSVLSGDDNLVLAQLAIGMDGVVSVAANEVPGEFSQMVHAALDGNFTRAREIHYRLLNLLDLNFIESSPAPVKTAMAMMGLIEETFRLPIVPLQDENKKKLRSALIELGLIKTATA